MQNFSMPRCLHIGSFGAERFWRDSTMVQLPGIPDPQADAIVGCMEEMLFTACRQTNDVLITRTAMDAAHKQYLHSIGFRFSSNSRSLQAEKKQDQTATCELLSAQQDLYFTQLLTNIKACSPYAVLPSTHTCCERYAIPQILPDIEIVKTVNAKRYSHQLSVDVLDESYGELVTSTQDLLTVGKHLLTRGAFLIKDDFGVSGKGNQLIDSPSLLERIVRYLEKQENKGKQTSFLLEPLLDKELDFSSQLYITVDGTVELLAVQQMDNAGFAFSAIQTADQTFIQQLETYGYLHKIQQVAARLYHDGYFGPVCIDSMLLKDGTIRSIVEINARQSMGFINHYVDRFLQPLGKKGSVLFFSLGLLQAVTMEDLLQHMQQAGILFTQEQPHGILPLSANTLNINCPPQINSNSTYKGRLYVSLVADSPIQRQQLKQQMRQVFTALGIKVYA